MATSPVNSYIREMDNPSVVSHAFYGNHDNSGEQMPPSSPGLAKFTYFRPHPHASLNPTEHMDSPILNPFDDSYRQNEIFPSHAFPSIDVHHPPWRNQPTPSSPTGSQVIESNLPNLRANAGEPDAAIGSRFPGHSLSSNQSCEVLVLEAAKDGEQLLDITPKEYGVHTSAKAYRGGAFGMCRETVIFSNSEYQRLYKPTVIPEDIHQNTLRQRLVDYG